MLRQVLRATGACMIALHCVSYLVNVWSPPVGQQPMVDLAPASTRRQAPSHAGRAPPPCPTSLVTGVRAIGLEEELSAAHDSQKSPWDRMARRRGTYNHQLSNTCTPDKS